MGAGPSHGATILHAMEGTVPNSAAAPNPHGGRQRPTRAEALVRLHDIALTGALDEVEFSHSAPLDEGPHTMAVDMSRVQKLSFTTVAALLWIRRCSKARGIEVVLRDTPPSFVDRLQRAGLLGVLAVEPPPAAGPNQ